MLTPRSFNPFVVLIIVFIAGKDMHDLVLNWIFVANTNRAFLFLFCFTLGIGQLKESQEKKWDK